MPNDSTGQAGAQSALKEPLETWQDFTFDEVARAREYPSDAEAFYLSGGPLIEGWIERKIGVIIYFRADFGIAGHGSADYLLTFDPPSKNRMMLDRRFADNPKLHVDLGNCRRRHSKGAMLIPVLDGLELPEKTGLRPFPSVVGLHTFNETEHPARRAY